MADDTLDSWLASTLADRRLSRGERQTLRQVEGDPGAIRARAFAMARDALADLGEAPILEWLEAVVRATEPNQADAPDRSVASAYFSPGDECRRAIEGLLRRAKATVDACVFTVTDDRLADALIATHRRGVVVRLITDDAKADDLGSDASRIEAAGIPVRVDRSPFHMHHKFAVADGSLVLTGSYNWTRGAAVENEENLCVLNDPRIVLPFVGAFDRLWAKLA